MTRMGGHRALIAGRFWRIALLTAAGAIGSVSEAQAALFYWSDSDSGYSQPGPTAPQQRQKPPRHQTKKIHAPQKEVTKPQGPLIIAISVEKQKLSIYDANGFFAESPISTGMKGHPTPMGVFSVIQKQKLHHSNIYSNAPMPYMQRITWSGIAIHAGVLPGYPASHGCIRMPMAFAIKMWNWTKMGARVVITPGEMTPTSITHPLLVAQKVVPQPAAEPQNDASPAPKSDKASDAGTTIKPTVAEARHDVKSTVGHGDGAKPASTSLREQTHTADASSDMPAVQPSVPLIDVAASANDAPPITGEALSTKASNSEAEPTDAKPSETASSDDKTVETRQPENVTAGIKTAETGTTDEVGTIPKASADFVKTEVTATEGTKAGEKKAEAKADDVKAEAPKPDAPQSSENSPEKPDESVKEVTNAGTGTPEAKKDPARLSDTVKPAAANADPAPSAAPKGTGQIAVFISRKDSKLYVRQNFAPLFDVPVTVAPSDRPLGTHIFTAQVDKDDANVVRWSVVSLPVPARHDADERALRRRKIAGATVEPKPLPVPDSAAEALDRLSIPPDALARITEALSTGASIIVSDQGIGAGETGEGTDFIVSLR
jgi:L,D-transpeptidase catalytic domain